MSDIAQRLSPDAAPWTTFRLAAIECTTCPESRDIPCSCMSLVLPVLLASSVCHCNHVKDLSLSQRQRRTTSSAPKATAKVHQSFQTPKFMTGFFRTFFNRKSQPTDYKKEKSSDFLVKPSFLTNEIQQLQL